MRLTALEDINLLIALLLLGSFVFNCSLNVDVKMVMWLQRGGVRYGISYCSLIHASLPNRVTLNY